MSDELRVTPTELRTVGNRLTSTSARLAGVLSSLNSTVDGEGAPWGGDEVGVDFATGGAGGGYVGQKASVNEAITAKVDLLDKYAQGLRDTADTLESGDSR